MEKDLKLFTLQEIESWQPLVPPRRKLTLTWEKQQLQIKIDGITSKKPKLYV
jgi:hypothetical protein